MPEIIYDAFTHTFFSIGTIDDDAFLEALWDQWDTDFCCLEILSQNIRHSHVSYNNRGYWEETDEGLPATLISGDVINLGPTRCPQCGKLMELTARVVQGLRSKESWTCRNCEYSVVSFGRARR